MSDNGWILTADRKPEQNRPVIAVWVMEEDWLKATLRRDGKWYSEADEREFRQPLKWRYPWSEPQEDTTESLNLELLDLWERLREVGWELKYVCNRLTFPDETE